MGEPNHCSDESVRIEEELRESHHRTIREYEARHGEGSWPRRILCLPKLPEDEMLDLIEKRLEEYSRLEADWDGYSAPPASADSLRDARIFIESRPKGVRLPYPQIETTGEVGFVWEFGSMYVELTMEGGGIFNYIACLRDEDGNDEMHHKSECLLSSGWPDELVRTLGRVG